MHDPLGADLMSDQAGARERREQEAVGEREPAADVWGEHGHADDLPDGHAGHPAGQHRPQPEAPAEDVELEVAGQMPLVGEPADEKERQRAAGDAYPKTDPFDGAR